MATVQTLRETESTTWARPLFAELAPGFFQSVGEGVEAMVHVHELIEPDPARHRVYTDLYGAYVKAYDGLAASSISKPSPAMQS